MSVDKRIEQQQLGKKSLLTETQKQKWMKVKTKDFFMSSEESNDDNTAIKTL